MIWHKATAASGRAVIRSTGLGAWPHRRRLPPAEGLTADDRPGDGTVHVEVAGLDAVDPARDLAVVERLDPAGEPEGLSVDELDRVVEVLGAHQSEHGAEAFGAVEEGAGTHAELDAGRPELRVVRCRARLEQPLLALVEHGERAPEGGAGCLRQRGDPAGRLPRGADGKALRSIAKLASEVGVVVHLGFANGEAGRRALLAVVAEGRADQIANRLIAIGESRDDDGVLAARLSEQREIGSPAEEQPRGLRRAGEDDAAHARVRHQAAPDLVVGTR